jgi:hypothetical protein
MTGSLNVPELAVNLLNRRILSLLKKLNPHQSSQYDSGRDMGCNEVRAGLLESKTVRQLEGYTDEFVQWYYY